MSALTQNIFMLIKHFQNRQAKYITSHINKQIQTLRDQNNSTLLHVCANNNNYEMAQYLINQYNRLIQQQPDQYSLKSRIRWLCTKDNEGFSCLHYSVFRGNYKLVRLFQLNGSDIYQVNNQGLTVLHIAAQGDSPLLIYYFLTKGLKIGVMDQKGNTPLHWACYSGMESSVYALLSWGAQIDKKQQSFGMTPLHLAVMSGNGRIVRKLLIKGCDRNIQNYNKKLPLQIAKQHKFKNIEQMIIDQRGLGQLCNLKTPYRKISKINLSFFIFVFLFLSTYLLNIVSFALSQHQIYEKGLYISFIIIGFLYAVLFIIIYLSNPGYLYDSSQLHRNMLQILLKYKSNKICFDCGIVKPERSKHCQICESCVSVYDHHCPWIANCIGSNNYYLFYSFLIFTIVIILHTFTLEISILVLQNWSEIKKVQIVKIVASIYSLTISFMFLVPVSILVVIQTKNLCQNRTTFQRYSHKKNNRKSSSQFRSSEATQQLRQQFVQKKRQTIKSAKIQLTDMSVDHSVSVQAQRNTAISAKILPYQQNQSVLQNCYNMCWKNRQNVNYKIGY